MTLKIMGVAVVLLLAAVVALGTGITVFALGARPLTAAGAGGTAFLGIAGLGMVVLGVSCVERVSPAGTREHPRSC